MNKDISFKIEKLQNNKYKIQVKINHSCGWVHDLRLNLENSLSSMTYPINHKENINGYSYFESIIDIPQAANYRYYFSYFVDGRRLFIKNNDYNKDNINKFEMFKLSNDFEIPNWAKGKIMYHIFVDRFNRSSNEKLKEMPRRTIHNNWDEEPIIGPDEEGNWNTDFYGGDLKGIKDKLDYIKDLGVSIIYLSPIVYSQSNHRYDTSDYEEVDPYAGNWHDLEELCNKAHEKGMKIILDAVFNHTGNDSKYFNEYNSFDNIGAFNDPNSKYAKFYKKRVVDGKTYFDYWWGFHNLPECNGNSEEWIDYITGKNGIIDKWFSYGIDGLRLDVADELTDYFIEQIRIAVKRNKKDGFIIGEVWKNPMRMNRTYIESGKGMDSVMNYPLVDALIRYFKYADKDKLRYIIEDIQTEYPEDTIKSLMNFTSTHDISRAINIFGTNEFNEYSEWAWDSKNNDREYQKNYKISKEDYENGKKIYKAYLFALTFLPGILSIFYGDEIGIEGLGNLSNRKPFTWDKIDTDLLEFINSIGKIRKEEQFLEEAQLKVKNINSNYFIFERELNNEKMLITINRTNKKGIILIPPEYEYPDKVYSLNNSYPGYIEPYGGIVLKKVLKNESRNGTNN